ncbi:MAG: glycosyltransferase family 1 protein [Sphingobacteriales bacterium]|nr:MAG: glycosyltransferase family 1 protein [Sphingobacteriales bacterium]
MKCEKVVYGQYDHKTLLDKVSRCKAVIFLCEHETQGLAYQQILSTGTPIIAWDRQTHWVDPAYFPEKVKFQPVSSVPYWDERCGMKFNKIENFKSTLEDFMAKVHEFAPRDYILEHLTLEKCAKDYVKIYRDVELS